MPNNSGSVAHAVFKIGNTTIKISDESQEWHAYAMPEKGMASCLFAIATENCNKSYEQAISAGAYSLSEPKDKFWGVRTAIAKDPSGYRWSFRELIEEVSPEEMTKRAKELFGT